MQEEYADMQEEPEFTRIDVQLNVYRLAAMDQHEHILNHDADDEPPPCPVVLVRMLQPHELVGDDVMCGGLFRCHIQGSHMLKEVKIAWHAYYIGPTNDDPGDAGEWLEYDGRRYEGGILQED